MTRLSHDQFFYQADQRMLKEDKKLGIPSPGDFAKSALKELLLYAFMAVTAVITVVIALSLRSWWPFAGWLVVVVAFAILLERFDR
jgi:hypothetical protein